MSKLDNFPKVYYITLEESADRRENLTAQFSKYGVSKITPLVSKRFAECNDVIHGQYAHTLTSTNKGCSTSFLRVIKKWLNETSDEYAFFCEDDLSLDTVQYWNFTWSDFVNHLPKDWDCIQMLVVKPSPITEVKLIERDWDDWAVTAFMLKRSYAQKLISKFYPGDEFVYNIGTIQPIVENIIYFGNVFRTGNVYSIPLFTEEVDKLQTTVISAPEFDESHVKNGQTSFHKESSYNVLNWWKQNGLQTSIKDLIMIPKKMIVDCCFYTKETSLLDLRLNLLNEVVDEFVLAEGVITSETSSFDSIQDVLNRDKVRSVEIKLPPDNEITLTKNDILMSLECRSENIFDWHRERLMIDEVMRKLVDEYPDDTVFMISDHNQIIKPGNVRYFADIVRRNPSVIIKVPLIDLHEKADARVYNQDDVTPHNDVSMFFCMKHHIKNADASTFKYLLLHEGSGERNPVPAQITSSTRYTIGQITEGGVAVPDCGWSFPSAKKLISKTTKTKPYPSDDLPQVIFDLPDAKKYLFGEYVPKFRFNFNKNPESTLWVVDNFFENPQAVREFAMQQEYFEGGFGRGFIGRRSAQRFLYPGLKQRFEQIMGMNITRWEEHEMNGKYQYCYNYEPLVYHCDNQRWAAAIYLTPDAPIETGTTLWRHRRLKTRSQRDPLIVQSFDKGHLEKSPYEAVDVAGNIFNRLVIWDAHAIHSASQYCGETLQDSRLFQIFFFD